MCLPNRTLRVIISLAAIAVGIAASPARADACSTNMIPAYFAPGPTSPWEQAIAGFAARTTMILNPASGPGTSPDPVYQDTVRRAELAGIHVIGYVHTSWGHRKSSLVRKEVDRYRSWYGVDGIFFDEAATASASLSYYKTLYRHVKSSPSALVVLNHGTVPDQRYMDASDVAVVFEGQAGSYLTAQMPVWATSYSSTRFADLVYGVDADSLDAVISLARTRGVGHLYATDDGLDNPWDTLPSYYDAQRSALEAGCAAV